MNPYILGAVALGGIALTTVASASIPAINNDSDTSDLPIDYSPDDTVNDFYSPDPNAQINAFLAVIRAGESSNNYYAKVGGGNLSTLATYTTIASVNGSRAVGAYQFEPETWREAAAALGLKNFEPASQDAAAIFLIKRRNAYNAIIAGDIPTACNLLKNEWQIFTLPRWNSDIVADAFVNNGGTTA